MTSSSNVDDGIDAYNKLHHSDSVEERNAQYKSSGQCLLRSGDCLLRMGLGHQSFHFSERLVCTKVLPNRFVVTNTNLPLKLEVHNDGNE